MSRRPFFIAGDAATEPPESGAYDPCPRCGRHLIDADECKCGWCNYEGAADPRAEDVALAQRGTSGQGAAPDATTGPVPASPVYCPRCNRHHARVGEAEEKCREGMRFAHQDHRRRGGTV